MGLILKNTSPLADYSGSGLGNLNWRASYYTKVGITNPTLIAAHNTFYDALVSAGITDKLLGLCLFPGSTAETQKVQFMSGLPELEFVGTSSANHVAGGFIPCIDTQIGWANTKYTINDMAIFSMGAYNNTSEQVPASNFACLMGGHNFDTDGTASLGRYLSTSVQTGGTVANNAHTPSAVGARVARDYTLTGLLSLCKVNNTFRALDGNEVIRTLTIADYSPVPAGGVPLILGGANTQGNPSGTNPPNKFSKARLSASFWGTLTYQEVQTFQGHLQTLLVALGRD